MYAESALKIVQKLVEAGQIDKHAELSYCLAAASQACVVSREASEFCFVELSNAVLCKFGFDTGGVGEEGRYSPTAVLRRLKQDGIIRQETVFGEDSVRMYCIDGPKT